MRTIGKKLPRNRPRGDYDLLCDLCGVIWPRSKMRKDAAGRMRCPDERGIDPVTLTKLNAEAAARDNFPQRPRDGGNFDSIGPTATGTGDWQTGPASDLPTGVHRTTAEDIAFGDVVDPQVNMLSNGVNMVSNNHNMVSGDHS